MRFHLSRFSASIVLFFGLLGSTMQARAEIVVSSFEEASLANQLNNDQSYEGEVGQSSVIHSGKVSFTNQGIDPTWGTWAGVGYSRKTATTGPDFWNQSNDFVAAPGAAATGSTWGVVYEDTYSGQTPKLTAESGYVFQSLAMTNTYWAWYTMKYGDPNNYAGPAFTTGDFFTVRFTNISTSDFVEYNLATGASIVNNWTTFNLAPLKASALSISFSGSRNDKYGNLMTPSYAAIDDVAVISAVPEPSSLALLAAGSSVGVWFRWRKSKRSQRSTEPLLG